MAQAQSGKPHPVTAIDSQSMQQSLWRKFFGQGNAAARAELGPAGKEIQQGENEPRPGLIRRVSRKVVPGLPRTQTFKRQQAEVRNNLEPVEPTPAERRAVSVDRRLHTSQASPDVSSNPRTSAPEFIRNNAFSGTVSAPSTAGSVYEEKLFDSIGEFTVREDVVDEEASEQPQEAGPLHDDAASMTTSQYDNMIHEELERIWILNLSMHFRDKSKREKFFVTYREDELHWRRVTISLDYRGAPDNSLEMDLLHTKFQRDKSAKIYEAIRESLGDIQFYETVTNLKLQTTDGRLHVHVVEDVNEIIPYPTARMVQHLMCRRVRESDIKFEAHMSGFVYKVSVSGETLIKKEIPGPDTVDEFLYEINALNQLCTSRNVINFYGVIVDDHGDHVKGLLISYAEQGALIDVIYDHNHGLPWTRRQKWARQIVEGLSEIHEAGFVQGDFTLSNIVVDHNDNAKIIDINRRGCPVGWEPPEATPLIESNQRISMYIGVKSDLYQLGMVLWALAEQEDEPEAQGRPLVLSEETELPNWYKKVVTLCLAENPQHRMSATELLQLFPPPKEAELDISHDHQSSISVADGFSVQDFLVSEHDMGDAQVIRTVDIPSDWDYRNITGNPHLEAPITFSTGPYYYPSRGRSPPSPAPNSFDYREARWAQQGAFWPPPNGHACEDKMSSSGLGLAPQATPTSNYEQENEPHEEEEPSRTDDNAEGPAAPVHPAVEDESGTPKQEDPGILAREGERPPAEAAQDAEAAEPPTEQPGETGMEETQTEVAPPPVTSTPEADSQKHAGTQDDASRGISKGVRNFFLSSNNKLQNPLFQEAGITEPAAPGTIALVPRAAELQKQKSASTIVDTRQGWEMERVDSAIAMNSPASLPELWSGSNLSDDILCLGSGHDYTSHDVVRNGNANAIMDDDFLSA